MFLCGTKVCCSALTYFVLYIALFNSLPTSAFLFGSNQAKILEPEDSLVFIGETLKIRCEPSPRVSNLSQIRLKFTAEENIWFHPEDQLEVIGNSRVETNVTISNDFTPTTTVSCFYGGTLLRSKKIYTEKPLLNVTNFGGFFLDDGYETYSKLSWSDNSDYYNGAFFVETKAAFSRNGIPEVWPANQTCLRSEACTVNYTGEYFIYMQFIVSHKRADKRPGTEFLQPLFEPSVTTVLKFNLNDNRKTGMVENLVLVDRQATCVNITWNMPFFFTLKCGAVLCPIVLYRVEVLQSSSIIPVTLENVTENISPSRAVQVCGLSPYTDYNLTVWVKAQDKNPWSLPSTSLQFRTAEDRIMIFNS